MDNRLLKDLAQMFERRAKGLCPNCEKNMQLEENLNFKDELSQKEFKISGLCQKCQDETFKEPTDEFVTGGW